MKVFHGAALFFLMTLLFSCSTIPEGVKAVQPFDK
jgi:hypothetical protein